MQLKLKDVFLADPGCSWLLGSFGAIAEFDQDAGETSEVNDDERLMWR